MTVTPFLWFEDQAEQAAELYVSIFSGRPGDDQGPSRIVQVTRVGEGASGQEGTAMTVELELDGQRFTALNGGPGHAFTDAVSFVVSCGTQQEVDHFWDALTADGGEAGPCGWLTDRFGLSWQIVPTALPELLGDPDPGRAQRAMQAMLQMQKLDIAELRRAAEAA